MTYGEIERAVQAQQLEILGAFHPQPGDDAPDGCETLLLLGPREPGFWDVVTTSPEWGSDDPIDRWSERIINELAKTVNGAALFPFGGPPYQPFIRWAERSGSAWASPVTILVHSAAGLMISYRGALAFRDRLELPPPALKPCDACKKPCLTACPVNALNGDGYNVAACHAYLDTPTGKDCLIRGCAVRRACPVSQNYGRLETQSAYHMSVFHK